MHKVWWLTFFKKAGTGNSVINCKQILKLKEHLLLNPLFFAT